MVLYGQSIVTQSHVSIVLGWLIQYRTVIAFELFLLRRQVGEAKRAELKTSVCASSISSSIFCFRTHSAVGEQLLKSQSADPFLNLEMDAGISHIQRSQSWLSNIGPTHHETDTASSHGPQMQDAFLSPLSNKGKCNFKS